MGEVYVYAPDADDLDCMGLCGALTPTSCIHTEEANGMSEIELQHPIDEHGRWSFLLDGYLLKAEVPVRTTPEIRDGALVTTVEKWTVSKNTYLYTKKSGGRKKKKLKKGVTLTVVAKGDTRHKAKARKYGTGWVPISAIDYVLTETIPNDPAAIEQVEPAWSVRSQMFRIYDHEVTDTGVTAHARHISYDLLGNCTTYDGSAARLQYNPTCVEAGEGILGGCVCPHDFEFFTNMLDTRAGARWIRQNPINALLDPEDGLCAQWGAEIVRDDWEITVLREAGLNRGLRIEYAKNLLGVKCEMDSTDVITRVIPVGQTAKGGALMMSGSAPWVDSPKINEYPVPHVYVLDLGSKVKAKSTKSADVTAARNKLRTKAQEKFDAEECDVPAVSLEVDFLNLGDTEEYREYAQMETLFLYDRVRVLHPELQIDALCEVRRMEWNCLTGRSEKIELGSVRFLSRARPIAKWQIPAGINGESKLARDSVSDANLAEFSVTAKALAEDSVEEYAILDGSVSPRKLSVGFMEAEEIKASIATIVLANLTTANIQNANIDWASIANLSAQMATIAAAQITAANIEKADIQWASIATLNAQIATIAAAQITAANIEKADIQWADIESLAASIATIAAAQITAANIEKANIQWADIAALNAAIASVARAQITTANIQSADINWAQIGSLQASIAEIVAARIKTADIDFARIKDLAADTAIITQGVGGELYINKLCVTDANMVSLATGELLLKDSQGNLRRLFFDEATGAVKSEVVKMAGDNIANGTISGGNLIQGTITARELNVAQIFADSALVGAIKAANIDVANLLASSAFVGKITTAHLASDVGATLNITSNTAILSKADKTVVDNLGVRMGSAEQKIAPDAITSTVRSSTLYKSDLADKLGTGAYNADKTALQNADVAVGAAAPASPTSGKLWVDTSSTPPQLKRWTGAAWQIVTDMSKADKAAVDDLAGRMNNAETSITQSSKAIEMKANRLDVERYMRFDADALTLGLSGNPFTCKITNSRISFMRYTEEIAYISESKFYITSGEIRSELKVGNYVLTSTADGGMAIKLG